MRKVIDAEFEVVSGPLRPGDEHPTRKGWYLTDQLDRGGNPLWYKPPGFLNRWTHRIALWIFVGMMALAMFSAFFVENPKA